MKKQSKKSEEYNKSKEPAKKEAQEFIYELKIPKERIPVLIGRNGQIKKKLEAETKTKLNIDSNEGDVFISGDDALGLFNCREIIRAISRGFNPDLALMLLKGDYLLEIIDLKDYAGKSAAAEKRLKGRVIGREGKSRRTIEELTETHISVYGKSISIIGEPENLTLARRAVEALLAGSPHANVYAMLEKKRKELKQKFFIRQNTANL